MPINRLDHVQVAAPRGPESEEQARAFYGGLLGLSEIEKSEVLKPRGGVWFSTGVGQLHVGIEDQFAPARKAHPAFVVSNLGELRRTMEAADVPISEADPIPGVTRFYAQDPFGNRLELMEVERDAGDRTPSGSYPGEKSPKEDKPEGARLGWRIVDTTYPFRTRWLTVREDRIHVEGGDEITFSYVDNPAAVCIVPVTEDGNILMIRQYRYTVDEWSLEVPAGGTHDRPGEQLEEVARAELGQEIGATCRDLREVATFYLSIGNSSQPYVVFLALGTVLDREQEPEQTEFIEVHPMPAREVVRLARSGEIIDGASAHAIVLCEDLLREFGYI